VVPSAIIDIRENRNLRQRNMEWHFWGCLLKVNWSVRMEPRILIVERGARLTFCHYSAGHQIIYITTHVVLYRVVAELRACERKLEIVSQISTQSLDKNLCDLRFQGKSSHVHTFRSLPQLEKIHVYIRDI
jgi:hypothetical protein